MRQMKRALSLLLAMVMLLGMVMVPTGAASNDAGAASNVSGAVSSNFADAELIENTEEVEITSGIGLFAGTTDGRFAPKATVTRAQMATIIVKMLRGNDFNADAFKGFDKFPDTASFEGGWAEGYINACVQLGVVAGYGDGTFQPGNELTTAEALTMIINALGVDPGPGDWPLNYMAKAEELKLYGDLASQPAADEPLNRDQLAVIVLAGLEYSPSGKSGYRIPGVDIVFTNIVDAMRANNGDISTITEVVGEDSLASKVYDLKKTSGIITGNQVNELEYTELNSGDRFNADTGLDMLGHFVTIYYREKYKNVDEPGLVYTVMDESTVVTVHETISSDARDYRTLFSRNCELAKDINNNRNVRLFTEQYVDVTDAQASTDPHHSDWTRIDTILASYNPGYSAAAGTYIVVDGVVVTYIEPVPAYASYIVDINVSAGAETVTLVANDKSMIVASNTEGDDQVVEYKGMAVGDIVTYVVVRGRYILSSTEKVTGPVTKTSKTDLHGKQYNTITVNDQDYLAFEYVNENPSRSDAIDTKAKRVLSEIEYEKSYVLYVTGDGHYVGFNPVSSGVSMENTVYLLSGGGFLVKEKDSYGDTYIYSKARGVDMEGNEVLLVLGRVEDKNDNGVYDPSEYVSEAENGVMDGLENIKGYYTVEDSKSSKLKKHDIKELTPYPTTYSPEHPTYALEAHFNGSFSGSGSIGTKDGIAAFGQSSMKFLLIDGTPQQSDPLTVNKFNGSISPALAMTHDEYYPMLVTRAANGAQNYIDIFVNETSEQFGDISYVYVTDEQVKNPFLKPAGKGYTVYSAATGKETEVIINPNVKTVEVDGEIVANDFDPNQLGFYRVMTDTDGLSTVTKHTVTGALSRSDNTPQGVENMGFWGMTGTRLRADRMASEGKVAIDMINNNNNGASSVAVVDVRTEEQIQADNVPAITSTAQLATLKENDPGLMVIFDLYMEDGTSSFTSKSMFVTRVERRTVGLNAIVYVTGSGVDTVSAVDENGNPITISKPYAKGFFVRGLTGEMGDDVGKVYYENPYTAEDLDASGNLHKGFYRYGVNADGQLALVPFDSNAGFYGSYGMVGIHNGVLAVTDSKLTTSNGGHANCGFECSSAAFEALAEVGITKETVIYDATALNSNGQPTLRDVNYLKSLAGAELVVDYYCASPVTASTAADSTRDTTAEMIVIYLATPADTCHHVTGGTATELTNANMGSYIVNGKLASGTYYLGENITMTESFKVNGNVTLCLNAHTLTAPKMDTAGTFITIPGGKRLELCGGGGQVSKIAGNAESTECTGITVEEGGSLNLTSGGISAFTAGGVYNEGTFTMSGGAVSGNSDKDTGAGVYNEGTFTMTGGSVSGNNSTGTGDADGGAGVYNSGEFVLDGGVVSGNSSAKRGGGVFNSGTFTMKSGSIKKNSASSSTGGGVHLHTGTFTMEGGTISGNTAQTYGGGLCVKAGTFTMSGGEISNNVVVNAPAYGVDIANGYYGGVGGTVALTGGKIGVADSQTNNLMINAGSASIQGTVEVNGVVALTGTNNPASLKVDGGTINGKIINGHEANSGYLNAVGKTYACTLEITDGIINGAVSEVKTEDLTVTLTQRGALTTTITGGTFAENPKDYVDESGAYVINEITDASGNTVYQVVVGQSCDKHGAVTPGAIPATLTGGTYVLDATGFATGAITVTRDSTLCLNNCVLKAPESITGAFVTVKNGATLTLCGGFGTNPGGAISGSNVSAYGVKVESGANLIINSGIITGFADSGVYNDGTVTMYGGEIKGNSAVVGGGVYNNGIFTMEAPVTRAAMSAGGKITGNTATSEGAVPGGGGVYNVGTFNMNGGSISANKTGARGGAMYLPTGGTFNMAGGTLTGNSASSSAAEIYNMAGTVNVTGGSIIGSAGNFIMTAGSATANVSGTAVIEGPSMYASGNLTITGGTVELTTQLMAAAAEGNEANKVIIGAGIINKVNSTGVGIVEITGSAVEVSGGVSNSGAGHVIISDGDVNGVSNTGTGTVTIQGDASVTYQVTNANITGGEVTANVTGGTITGGDIKGDVTDAVIGGGTVSDGTVTGGTINGGTVSSNVTDTTISGGTITGTVSDADITGGIFNSKPDADHLADGYTAVDNGNGTWTVLPASCNDHEQAGSTAYAGGDLTGGIVYLDKSWNDLTAPIIVKGDVTLCLNGFVLGAPASGDAAIIVESGKLTIHGGDDSVFGKILGNNAAMYGVKVLNGAELEMTSGTITGFANSGVYNAGTFTMNGGSISANKAQAEGGGIYNEGIANLNGGEVSANKTATEKHGGGVYNAGTLNLSGSAVISENTVSGNGAKGGGIYTKGTINMTGGTIKDNSSASSTGGGVHIETGTFTMNGGTITGNGGSQYGGGVCVQNGTFNLVSGTIEKNTLINAQPYGFDVACGYNHNTTGSVIMSGGTIGAADSAATTYNLNVGNGTTTISGGTVYGEVGTVGMFTMPATLIIEGGTINGNVSNGTIPMPNDKERGTMTTTITNGTVNGSVTGATIEGGTITGNVTDATISGGTVTGNMTGGELSGGIINGDATNATVSGGAIKGTMTGGTITGVTTVGTVGAGVDYSGFEQQSNPDGSVTIVPTKCADHVTDGSRIFDGTAATLSAGTYYLTNNVTMNGTITIMGNAVLCLNGWTLTAPADLSGAFITVAAGKTLTICGGSGGTVRGQNAGTGIEVYGALEMLSGTITGFADSGVLVNSGKTFDMTGGTISGNAGSGVNNAGTFNMSGTAVITANTGSGVNNAGTFTMTGGEISGNSAENGGGVYNTGIFEMNGDSAVITGNTATVASGQAGGGGVYNAGTFTLTEGTISQNKAAKRMGGGVFNGDGTFTMNGGEISANEARSSTGGGVQANAGTFTMTGGTITGNTAQTYGGGVCVNNETFTMTGGTIKANGTVNGGTGGWDVAVGYNGSAGTGVFEMSGGTVGADTNGVYLVVNEGAMTLSGTAQVNGELCTTGTGGAATITMTGGTVTGSVVNGETPHTTYTAAPGTCTTAISGGTVTGNVTGGTITGGSITGDVTDSTISGGTVSGTVTGGTISGGTISGGTITGSTITGGTFTGMTMDELNALLSGYEAVDNGDGTLGVKVKEKEPTIHSCYDSATEELQPIDGPKTISTSGKYVLTNNVTGKITVSAADVTICLDGHNITSTAAGTITLSENAQLTLCNCGTADDSHGVVSTSMADGVSNVAISCANSGSVLTIKDGVTVKATNSRAIYVHNGGTVNLEGGTIEGGTVGIMMYTGTVNMSGGIVKGTPALSGSNPRGGFYLNSTAAEVFMKGGTITGGERGVALNKGNFTLEGGTIEGCTVDGIYLHNQTDNLNLISGTITNCGYSVQTYATEKNTVDISGGNYASALSLGATTKVTITGGKFAVAPDASWLADGYATLGTGDATYAYEVVSGNLTGETINGDVSGVTLNNCIVNGNVTNSTISGDGTVINGNVTNSTISGDETVINGNVTGGTIFGGTVNGVVSGLAAGDIIGGKFSAIQNAEAELTAWLADGRTLEAADDGFYWKVVEAPGPAPASEDLTEDITGDEAI